MANAGTIPESPRTRPRRAGVRAELAPRTPTAISDKTIPLAERWPIIRENGTVITARTPCGKKCYDAASCEKDTPCAWPSELRVSTCRPSGAYQGASGRNNSRESPSRTVHHTCEPDGHDTKSTEVAKVSNATCRREFSSRCPASRSRIRNPAMESPRL